MFDLNLLLQKEVLVLLFVVILITLVFFVCEVLRNQKSLTAREQKVKKTILSKDFKGTNLKSNILAIINSKIDVEQRNKIESRTLQAGLNWSYGELKLYCILCAILLPVISYVALANLYLSCILCVIGYFLPKFYVKGRANKRVELIEDQVGAFLRIIVERYKNNREMSACLQKCLNDFKGQEPFYTILKQANIELAMSIPCGDVLRNMARATGNVYMDRFADYYNMAENLGSHELKVETMKRPFLQYSDDREIKLELKEQINGPVSEANIMLIMTPVFMLWQCFITEGYLDFMLHTDLGKMGTAGILVVLILCYIFTKVKIGGPIDN